MRYLLLHDLNDINSYCKSRCKKIINEHDKTTLKYSRGQYKGYMYGISLSAHFSKLKVKITQAKLYKIMKDEKNKIQYKYVKDTELKKGLMDSLYDLMNYISSLS